MGELAPLVFLGAAVVLWAIGRGIDRLLRRSGLGLDPGRPQDRQTQDQHQTQRQHYPNDNH